ALGLHALDHLGHGRPGGAQPLSDPRRDDLDLDLLVLPDRLAVLLEPRVELGGLVLGHGSSLVGHGTVRSASESAIGRVRALGRPVRAMWRAVLLPLHAALAGTACGDGQDGARVYSEAVPDDLLLVIVAEAMA